VQRVSISSFVCALIRDVGLGSPSFAVKPGNDGSNFPPDRDPSEHFLAKCHDALTVNIMIIDTHVHVISDDQQKYPRRADAQEWVRDTSAEMLLALNREAGVDRTVLVQGHGAYEFDNSYAADCARQYPDNFVSVCIVDQHEASAADQLTYWVCERGVSGLRLFAIGEPEPLIDDARTFTLWERAVALTIPICIMARFHQVARLAAMLERFPEARVALDHLTLPRLREGPPYDSVESLFELARFPNLYLKFSTETLYAARRGRSTPKEFFSRLLERFGANHIMWGSNYPATHDRSFKEQVELAREDLAFLSQEDRRWLFGETALSLWPALR
jgi:L-fuconolactonase